MTGPILTTERMILTPVSVTDYEDHQALWRDEAFNRHITGGSPLSGEEVWSRLLRDIGHWQAMGHGNWTIRLKSNSAYVGGVGVLEYRRALDPPFDAPEIGWGVSGAFQGQGLAREAVEAAFHWIDTVMGAPRTACMIDPGNTASLRLADKMGFRPYGLGTYKGLTLQLLDRLRP